MRQACCDGSQNQKVRKAQQHHLSKRTRDAAWAAVQVLVAAPGSKIHAPVVQLQAGQSRARGTEYIMGKVGR